MKKLKDEAVIVSACLVGVPCRFDGGACRNPVVDERVSDKQAVLVCPEELGGLPTPRPRAWIEGGAGAEVLDGTARVVDEEGVDVTASFLRGAEEALSIAQRVGATKAYLKARSPSCGLGRTYGTGNTLVDGDGVTAARLRREGIDVWEID